MFIKLKFLYFINYKIHSEYSISSETEDLFANTELFNRNSTDTNQDQQEVRSCFK